MSSGTFRCKVCGRFAERSSRAGHCRPCAAKYRKNLRMRKKMERNGNDGEITASYSNGDGNLQIPINPGVPNFSPKFSGGHIYPGIPQYPMNYPINPYHGLISPQNIQIDNEMIRMLLTRLSDLEKRNEELEEEVASLRQDSGIDPNVKLDPHPYGEEYEPKLHPRELEMRICYNDIMFHRLEKNTIEGVIFKSLDELQESTDVQNNTLENIKGRLENLEKETKCLDGLGMEIEKLKEAMTLLTK